MDKVLSYLGLARRAGKILFGDEILENFSRGSISLLFLAKDISPKSRDRFAKKCLYYKVPLIEDYSADELSAALGRPIVKTAAVCDHGFAKAIQKERRCVDGKEQKTI